MGDGGKGDGGGCVAASGGHEGGIDATVGAFGSVVQSLIRPPWLRFRQPCLKQNSLKGLI